MKALGGGGRRDGLNPAPGGGVVYRTIAGP